MENRKNGRGKPMVTISELLENMIKVAKEMRETNKR